MTRLRKQESSIVSLTMLFALSFVSGTVASGAAAKPPAVALMVRLFPAQMASAIAFPLTTSVPVGTTIRIGGSSSMETINQALKRRFEAQFVGTKIALNTQGTGPAIKDLMDGNTDLAAIGRMLMEQEKAQGLVAVPVSRQKIAIIVGTENPFKGSLTLEQFAKIFRGEIKDWAQVGGEPGPIRLIDRPDNSDTRQAFRNYSVFKQAPFVTGKTARQLSQDSTSQVVQALQTSGIGYAIADQLQGRGEVRVVPMSKTLPNDPKYPFSQPLIYVYKGPQPNLAAQSFLGYATAPGSRQTIETARKEATAAIANEDVVAPSPKVTGPSPQAVPPSAIASPQTPAPSPQAGTPTTDSSASWLWLLALPLVGGFLWWLRQRNTEPALEEDLEEGMPTPMVDLVLPVEPIAPVEPVPTLAPIVPIAGMVAPLLGAIQPAGDSRLTLVPHDCLYASAHWFIPADGQALLQQQGAQKLVLRLYDVTGIDINQQPPESLQEFDCDAQATDRTVPIRTADRTYLAELGYVADDGRWLQVARSEPVHIPACPPPPTANASGDTAAIGAAQPSDSIDATAKSDDGTLTDKTHLPTEVTDEALTNEALTNGALTNGAAIGRGFFADRAATPTVLAADRTVLDSTLDPNTGDSRIPLAPTNGTAFPAEAMAFASGVVVGVGTVAFLDCGRAANGLGRDRATDTLATPPQNAFVPSTLLNGTAPDSNQLTRSQLSLVPRPAHHLYVYWHADQAEKDALKQQGGQHLTLRVYTVPASDTPLTHDVQQYFCNDWDHDQSVPIAVSNLDYVAELGYITLDGRFLLLARSTQTRVPGA